MRDLEDDTDQVKDVQANNEYVELEDLHPNEFEDDDWVNSTRVENITSEFNKPTTPTATEDLKVNDIFASKVKLLQAITEWSIKHGVSFEPMKCNKTCYTAVCASIIEDDNVGRDVCPWRLHASVPRVRVGTSRLNVIYAYVMYESIHVIILHSDPITVKQSHLCVQCDFTYGEEKAWNVSWLYYQVHWI